MALQQVSKEHLLHVNYPTVVDDADYQPGPYTAMIPAGSTSASFDVNIIDDNIFETRLETFRLAIIQTSQRFVIPTTPDRTSVIIIDDDSKFVSVICCQLDGYQCNN